jgi:hypothetical protein
MSISKKTGISDTMFKVEEFIVVLSLGEVPPASYAATC